jgi:colanic acid biosynthesis protein WcaH
MKSKGFLPKEEFLELIKTSRLPSIDLIIFNEHDEVLLGERLNRPAQGFHFAPGGRIFTGESEQEAFERIVLKELGIILSPNQYVRLEKKYKHDYTDNMFNVEGIGTHYDPVAFVCYIPSNIKLKNDDQHSGFKSWNINEALADEKVHSYTKQYILDALS